MRVPPSKIAVKLEIPAGDCTLGQLRTAVALEVPGAGPAAGVLLSFNNKVRAAPWRRRQRRRRRVVQRLARCTTKFSPTLPSASQDPLDGGDDTPLRELGVCSGDTLWLLSPVGAAQAPVAAAAAAAAAQLQPAEPAVKRARDSTQQQPLQQPPIPAGDKGKQQAAAREEAAEAEAMAVEDAALYEGEEAGPQLPPSQRLPTYLLRTLQQSCNRSSSPAEVLFLAAHAAMLETGFVPRWADEGQVAAAGSSASSSSSSSAFQVPASARASSSISRVHFHLVAANNGSNCMDEEPAGGSEQQQQEQQAPACTLQCSSMGGGAVVLAVSTQSHTRHLSLHAASFTHPLPVSTGPSSSSSSDGSAIASQTVQLLPSGGLAVGGHLQLEAAAAKQLWTRLKDGLAFPMLLAAYAEAGLPPPAGLLALPEDLKQRLLTALGVGATGGAACLGTALLAA